MSERNSFPVRTLEFEVWARPTTGQPTHTQNPNHNKSSGPMVRSYTPPGPRPSFLAPSITKAPTAPAAPSGTFGYEGLRDGFIYPHLPGGQGSNAVMFNPDITGPGKVKYLGLCGLNEGWPKGWERAIDNDGFELWIDHNNMATYWLPPNMDGTPGTMPDATGLDFATQNRGQQFGQPAGQGRDFGQQAAFAQPMNAFHHATGAYGAPAQRSFGNQSYSGFQPRSQPSYSDFQNGGQSLASSMNSHSGSQNVPGGYDEFRHPLNQNQSLLGHAQSSHVSSQNSDSYQTNRADTRGLQGMRRGVMRLNDEEGSLAVMATNYLGQHELRKARPAATQRQASRFLGTNDQLGMRGRETFRSDIFGKANATESPGRATRSASTSSTLVPSNSVTPMRRASTSSINVHNMLGRGYEDEDDQETPRASNLNPRPSGNIRAANQHAREFKPPGEYKEKLLNEIHHRASKVRRDLLREQPWFMPQELNQIAADKLKKEIEAELQDPHKQAKAVRERNLDLIKVVAYMRPDALFHDEKPKRRPGEKERQDRMDQAVAHAEEKKMHLEEELRAHRPMKNLENAQPGDLYHLRPQHHTRFSEQERDEGTSTAHDKYDNFASPEKGPNHGEKSPLKFHSQEKPKSFRTPPTGAAQSINDMEAYKQPYISSPTESEISDVNELPDSFLDDVEVSTDIPKFLSIGDKVPDSTPSTSNLGATASSQNLPPGNGSKAIQVKVSGELGKVSTSYERPLDRDSNINAQSSAEDTAPSAIPRSLQVPKYTLKARPSALDLRADSLQVPQASGLRKRPSLLFLEGSITDAMTKAESIAKEGGIFSRAIDDKPANPSPEKNANKADKGKGKEIVQVSDALTRMTLSDDEDEFQEEQGEDEESEEEENEDDESDEGEDEDDESEEEESGDNGSEEGDSVQSGESSDPFIDQGMHFYKVFDPLFKVPSYYSVKTGQQVTKLPKGYIIVQRQRIATEHLESLAGPSRAPNGSLREQPQTNAVGGPSRAPNASLHQQPQAQAQPLVQNVSTMNFLGVAALPGGYKAVSDSGHNLHTAPAQGSHIPLPPPRLVWPPLPDPNMPPPPGMIRNPIYDPTNQFVGPHRELFIPAQPPTQGPYDGYGYAAPQYAYGPQVPMHTAGFYAYQQGVAQYNAFHAAQMGGLYGIGGPYGMAMSDGASAYGNASFYQQGYPACGVVNGGAGGAQMVVPEGQQQLLQQLQESPPARPFRPYVPVRGQRSASWTGPRPSTPDQPIPDPMRYYM